MLRDCQKITATAYSLVTFVVHVAISPVAVQSDDAKANMIFTAHTTRGRHYTFRTASTFSQVVPPGLIIRVVMDARACWSQEEDQITTQTANALILLLHWTEQWKQLRREWAYFS